MDYKNWNLDYALLVFFEAYTGKAVSGKGNTCGIPYGQRSAGVYFIKENGKLVYVGMSGSSVKKALYRHFQKWNDIRHRPDKNLTTDYTPSRVMYDAVWSGYLYEVSIIEVADKREAMELEKRLILKHTPRDNKLKINHFMLSYNDQLVNRDQMKYEFKEDDYFDEYFYSYNKSLDDDGDAPF